MKAPKRKPNTTEDWQLACMYGEPWMGEHPLCEKAMEEDLARVDTTERRDRPRTATTNRAKSTDSAEKETD